MEYEAKIKQEQDSKSKRLVIYIHIELFLIQSLYFLITLARNSYVGIKGNRADKKIIEYQKSIIISNGGV